MRTKFWANLALCVVIGVCFVFGVTQFSSALTPKGLFIGESEPSADVAALVPKVQLANYTLSEGANRMVKADFIIDNKSEKDVKNFNVLCEFYSPSGKFLDRELWLLAGKVPAGKTMQHSSTSERFIHTGAKGLQCKLIDFEVASAPSFVLHRATGGHGHGGHGDGEHGHGAPAHETSAHGSAATH